MVIKNNINGILHLSVMIEIFADEIIGLLKNPEKAKRLGKQASELREQLNIKKIAKEWEKYLKIKLKLLGALLNLYTLAKRGWQFMIILYIGNVGYPDTASSIHVRNRAIFMKSCGHEVHIL